MQKTLFLKAAVTAILALLLVVPLGMIEHTVSERQARQARVVIDIAQSFAGGQRIAGPILVLPFVERYTLSKWVNEPIEGGGVTRVQQRQAVAHQGRVVVLPELAESRFAGSTDFKRRGLFKSLVFNLDGTIGGRFKLPAEPEIERRSEDSEITWGQAFLSLGLSDTRGLTRAPSLEWNGLERGFEQGTELGAVLPQGIHAKVDARIDGTDHEIGFEIDLGLRGTQSVSFVPLAETTRVALTSDWPHPSFQGRFLPDPEDQRIDQDGFSAAWEVTDLATTAPGALLADLSANKACAGSCLEWLGVQLIEPVNIYSMADRALKYSFLFIALGFAAFFLFELLKALRIHPAQYLLVGLALALFFLLLLSLSEHLVFAQAYAIAATACIGLQGFYLSHVLGGWRRGVGFAALLGALFAALYGLLVSEDASLLLGSLLLFGLLALTMVITRRLDWYAIGGGVDVPARAERVGNAAKARPRER